MSARTRGLPNKDVKKNYKYTPFKKGKNCMSCYRNTFGYGNDTQSLGKNKGSTSSASLLSRLSIDPCCNDSDEMSIPFRRRGTRSSRGATPDSNTLPNHSSNNDICVIDPSKQKQTKSTVRPGALVLEHGLDQEYNYIPAPYHYPELEVHGKGVYNLSPPDRHVRQCILWSLFIVLVAITVSITYIKLTYPLPQPGDHLQLSHVNHDIKVKKPDFGDSKRSAQHNSVNDQYSKVDIDQLQSIMNRLEKELQEKTEDFRQQYQTLQEKVKQMTIAINSIEETTRTQNSKEVDVHNDCMRRLYEEMAIYDADKMGIPDFALESSGGSIISTPDTELLHFNSWVTFWKIHLWSTARTARNIIQASGHPGDCWAFVGSTGKVIIQLAMPVHITAFTMEHIPPSISPTGKIDSAPKIFAVFGLRESDDTEGVALGQYTYNKAGTPRQTFHVEHKNTEMEQTFKAVKLWILTNHGNREFTCVYRFRVHGHAFTKETY